MKRSDTAANNAQAFLEVMGGGTHMHNSPENTRKSGVLTLAAIGAGAASLLLTHHFAQMGNEGPERTDSGFMIYDSTKGDVIPADNQKAVITINLQ